MGWLLMIAIVAGAMALLIALGVPRVLWSFVGAALMLGAAGYAWQGSPTTSGTRPDTRSDAPEEDPGLTTIRDAMLGRFTLDGAYLIASDAMATSGDHKAAIRALLGGINRIPQSYPLWTALGTAYARHDGGQVSPASRFAFAQARRLAPNNAAAPFFEGLAHARAGDLPAARRHWLRALALTPPEAPYRQDIALRLAILDRLMAMQQSDPALR